MARVFVSYRRADGRMAVDWIAERLQDVGVADDVQAAFHDGGLRGGDDFAAALIAELGTCDLVIAVIGPEWEGRSDHGPSRIQDAEDWVVKELATAHALDTRVVPVLFGGAELPATADLHESIDWLPGRHALPFHRASDLDKIVGEIEEFLHDLDLEAATREGLENEIVVPQLLPTRKLAPLLAAGGTVGFLIAFASAFLGADRAAGLGDTSGYDWYSAILLVYGIFGGIAAPVGVLIAVRLMRRSVTRWKELIAAALMVSAVPSLMILANGGSHFVLADSDIDLARLRAYGNLSGIVVALAAWAYAVGAPIFARARADDHELGKRVLHLALMRDAERWGIIIGAVILSIGTSVSVALEAAADQVGGVGDGFDELTLISIPVVLSALIFIVHRWAVASMAEMHVSIDARLQNLVEPYKSHGVGKMAAAPLADGGWMFRLILATPAIVACAGVALFHLAG